MGRRRTGRVVTALLGLLAAGITACTRSVEGTPSAAPPHSFPVTTSPPAERTPAPPPRGAALQADVLADECLLDARQLATLLGRPVRHPEQSVVHRGDGTRSSTCSVTAADGTPLAAINVYRVRAGTPEEFVRAAAAGGRALRGAGSAAAVLDTTVGPTLQVADTRFVVTVAVQGRPPDDAAWRAAARAALARLPP